MANKSRKQMSQRLLTTIGQLVCKERIGKFFLFGYTIQNTLLNGETMNHFKRKTKDKNKSSKDNVFLDCFAEFSFTLVFELLISIIWNIILFIPRVLIRALSNIF